MSDKSNWAIQNEHILRLVIQKYFSTALIFIIASRISTKSSKIAIFYGNRPLEPKWLMGGYPSA